jgi:hypothetical protein
MFCVAALASSGLNHPPFAESAAKPIQQKQNFLRARKALWSAFTLVPVEYFTLTLMEKWR